MGYGRSPIGKLWYWFLEGVYRVVELLPLPGFVRASKGALELSGSGFGQCKEVLHHHYR